MKYFKIQYLLVFLLILGIAYFLVRKTSIEPYLPASPVVPIVTTTSPAKTVNPPAINQNNKALQITNPKDGANCTNAYSYWPSLNENDTELFLNCDNQPWLYDFDPVNLKFSNKQKLFGENAKGLDWEDAIWSNQQNNILFARAPLALYAYDTKTGTATLVHDFKPDLPGKFLWQMSMSTDDNRFAWTIKDPTNSYKVIGYAAWDRNSNKIIYQKEDNDVDEVQLDKSGKFLTVKTTQESAGQVRVKIVNLDTLSITELVAGTPDFATGHYDSGTGMQIGVDDFQNAITEIDLNDPKHPKILLGLGKDWSQAAHISFLGKDENWVLVSFFTANTFAKSNPFDDKIILLKTDGSGEMKVLGSHGSSYKDYWDTPRADLSRDGKYVIYTSNQGTGRRDVFLLKVD